jgi:transcription termination factor NusB
LEERSDIVNNEIKRMNIALKELEIRRLEEEATTEEISKHINHREADLKLLDDSIKTADLEKERLVNSVNDQKDDLDKNQRDSDKLSSSLKRLMETHTKVLLVA